MTAKLFATLAAGLLASSALAAPTPTTTTQLPRGVQPLAYDITLVPDAAASRFTGTAKIDIEVSEPTDRIVLNALELTFAAARLTTRAKIAPFGAPKITLDNDAQTATFTFARPLGRGRYTLELDYAGVIGTQPTGLFSLDYETTAGKRRALYTQFENSDARRMIPSWDEPSYKATFHLSVEVPKGQMAVSNTPVASSADGGDRRRISFAPTPKMSTYLLFFGLGDFDRITGRAGPTEVGVIAKRGAAAQGQFALDSSVAVLNEYNDYFGTPYPLPKLDNIAAPGRSQFFGAMENWGAIFTFEFAILLDPAISNQRDKQGAFSTAAHEIAHQWFGDLVTMGWWDDLWLNEGFASWMEGRTTAKLHPEWNTALDAVNGRERAIGQDALSTTHPIIQKIATVEQASQAFDSITYQKGEAVIAMLEAYVGADAWRDGVRRYMKAHAYSNTVSDDLWREMDKGGKPVSAIAHQFTLRPGVPLITTATNCTGGNSVVTLTQTEFFKDKRTTKPLIWQVPVTAAGAGGSITTLVEGGRGQVTVPGCSAVVVNAGQKGYFRTLYAPSDFAGIADGFATIAPIDQMGILSDSYALGLTGQQPVSDALMLAQRLPVDADPQIWGEVVGTVASLNRYYRGEGARQERFQGFARKLLAPVLARTGWTARPDDAPTVATLRAQLIDTLGRIGDPAVIAEARRRFDAGGAELPTPILKAVLSVVAYNADTRMWDRLHAAALAEKTPLIRDQYFGLLGGAADPALAKRALALALTDEPGVTNSASIIRNVAAEHPDSAFDFAVANQAVVDARLDTTSRSRFYAQLAGESFDPTILTRLDAYAAKSVAATSRRPVDEAAARINYGVGVRRDRLPQLDTWLAKTSG